MPGTSRDREREQRLVEQVDVPLPARLRQLIAQLGLQTVELLVLGGGQR